MHTSPVSVLSVPGLADTSPLELFDHACRSLLGRGTEFTDTVVDRIRTEVPYYADPVLAPPDVRMCVDTGIRHALEATLDPGRIADIERFTRELGIRRAEQGRPLDEVLHAYRVAYRASGAGSSAWWSRTKSATRDSWCMWPSWCGRATTATPSWSRTPTAKSPRASPAYTASESG